ncbi:MAG: dynamin family protein [Candidatus Acidiferrales bacterium]
MSATRGNRQTLVQEVSATSSLLRLAEFARGLGSDRVNEDATALAERMGEGRFYVACVGQFKRGKSTLLGALVGNRVLPAGVLPVTAVPTIVRYGPSRSARVRFQGGTWMDISPEDLTHYVSEDRNPENKRGVAGVEVFCPSPLLLRGMCFVDTPGLGSVFTGNTAATQAFVPHIDAAIVVVGADPPISGEELALVEQVGKQVRDVIVVMNKADRTSDEDRRIARSFTAEILAKRLGRPVDCIYEVSAEERLENRGPDRDWRILIAALEKLERESGRCLVRAAAERGLRRLSEELLAVIAEERGALLRPIEESERRMQDLRQTIADASRSLRDLGYLFTAEEHRLSDMFLAQRKQFLAQTLPVVNAEFGEELKKLPRAYGPKFRRDAMRTAQLVAERHVRPWLQSEQAAAEEEYRKVAARFVGIGNEFLTKLSAAGMPELARTPSALDAENGFRVPSRFTFEELLRVSLPASPLRYLGDVLLGAIRACAVIERAAREFLDRLMQTNSTRVQSDVVNRSQESRGQLEVEIRKLLHEVSQIAQRALDRARTIWSEGAPAVEAAIARLDGIEHAIEALRAQTENQPR